MSEDLRVDDGSGRGRRIETDMFIPRIWDLAHDILMSRDGEAPIDKVARITIDAFTAKLTPEEFQETYGL